MRQAGRAGVLGAGLAAAALLAAGCGTGGVASAGARPDTQNGQQLFTHELDRDVVGDELAVGEQRLDPPAERRAARDRSALEIAGRDVRDLVLGRDLLCLRPLARSLRSQDEDVYLRNPS